MTARLGSRKAVLLTAFFLVLAGGARAEDLPFSTHYPLIDKNRWYLSDGWSNGDHQSCEWRADAVSFHDKNLLLSLSNKGGKVRPLGCPEIHTTATSSYGRYEARMRTAAGSGLNTAFFTYVGPPTGSPEHDEIDFEFLGHDTQMVEITHYTNAHQHAITKVALGFDASQGFHDYAFEWTRDAIRWYVDGKLVHETDKGDAVPRNAMRIYLSLWSGSKIEDAWMGPFAYKAPVTAEVAWAKFTPLP